MKPDEKTLQFEITDDERLYLRDLMRSPGYAVLLKIQKAYVESLRESATSLSLGDVLNNSAGVVNAWTYAKLATNLVNALQSGVAFELEILRLHQADTQTPEERARLRQRNFALQAIGS